MKNLVIEEGSYPTKPENPIPRHYQVVNWYWKCSAITTYQGVEDDY
jgi:hypothetical protein